MTTSAITDDVEPAAGSPRFPRNKQRRPPVMGDAVGRTLVTLTVSVGLSFAPVAGALVLGPPPATAGAAPPPGPEAAAAFRTVSRAGRIEGVLHACGVEAPAQFERDVFARLVDPVGHGPTRAARATLYAVSFDAAFRATEERGCDPALADSTLSALVELWAGLHDGAAE